jgi:hypothetical protein
MKTIIEYKTKAQHNALLAFSAALKMKLIDVDKLEDKTFYEMIVEAEHEGIMDEASSNMFYNEIKANDLK